MVTYRREPEGVILSPAAMVSFVAAATTGILWATSAGRTVRLTKIVVENRNAAATLLNIGRGDFVQLFPGLFCPAGLTSIFTEDEIPAYWWGEMNAVPPDNITAQVTVAAAAPADIRVRVEVEEKGA